MFLSRVLEARVRNKHLARHKNYKLKINIYWWAEDTGGVEVFLEWTYWVKSFRLSAPIE